MYLLLRCCSRLGDKQVLKNFQQGAVQLLNREIFVNDFQLSAFHQPTDWFGSHIACRGPVDLIVFTDKSKWHTWSLAWSLGDLRFWLERHPGTR